MSVFDYQLICTYTENTIAASIILVTIKIMEQINVQMNQ